jgi:DnaJ-class molecular chaperone
MRLTGEPRVFCSALGDGRWVLAILPEALVTVETPEVPRASWCPACSRSFNRGDDGSDDCPYCGVKVPRPLDSCPHCDGRGWINKYTQDQQTQTSGMYQVTCTECDGTGKVQPKPPEVCPECRGTGRIVPDFEHAPNDSVTCPTCGGSGRAKEADMTDHRGRCHFDHCRRWARFKDGEGRFLCGIHRNAQRVRARTVAFEAEVAAAEKRFSFPIRAAAVSRRTVIVYLDELVKLLEGR